MKKQYSKPIMRVYEIEPYEVVAFSGQNNGKGNHKGWDNPHNPHYKGDNAPEYRNTLWGDE